MSVETLSRARRLVLQTYSLQKSMGGCARKCIWDYQVHIEVILATSAATEATNLYNSRTVCSPSFYPFSSGVLSLSVSMCLSPCSPCSDILFAITDANDAQSYYYYPQHNIAHVYFCSNFVIRIFSKSHFSYTAAFQTLFLKSLQSLDQTSPPLPWK
jgi:hypothetical protein